MGTYSDKMIDMGGWDIAHAIRFKDINEAIKKAYATPVAFSHTEFMTEYDDDEPEHKLLDISGSYHAPNLIATHEGEESGFFAALNIDRFSIVKLKKAKPGDPITTTQNGINYTHKSQPFALRVEHPVGIIGSLEFEWHQPHPQKHQLKIANDVDKIEIYDYKTILHPTEALDSEGLKETKIYFNILLEKAFTKSFEDTFNHILATIDYTQVAEHHASWLRPTSHGCFAQRVDTAPAVNLSAVDYETSMDVNHYPTGYLAILGMTNNRPRPDSVPANLDALIPENCKAGFAYNQRLIIPNLIAGHLSEVFDANVEKDFAYTNPTSLHNIKEIKLKEKVELELSSELATHPQLTGMVASDSVSISLNQGKIAYHTSINYHVPKADISLIFPYNINILQSVDMIFDYQINERGYAILALHEEPKVDAFVTPEWEQSQHMKSFWEYARSFAIDLAISLATLGITMALLKAGRAAYSASKWLGKIKISSMGEVAKMEEVIAHKSMVNEMKNIEGEIAEITREEKIIASKTETELINAKKTNKIGFVKTALKLVWEVVLFSVVNTLLQMGREKYIDNKMSDLTEEANRRAFVTFINTALCTISWASQDDEKQFTIKEGGLAQGGFIVGMDITFKN